MTIAEAKSKLEVGDWVRTNGSGFDTTNFFEGKIGEITESRFYVWQNEKMGCKGKLSPTSKGYKCSWEIDWNNSRAEIEILRSKNADADPKTLTSKLTKKMKTLSIFFKRLVDSDTQSLYKVDYINGELALTERGKNALLVLLFAANKKELVQMAEEEIAEAEKAK